MNCRVHVLLAFMCVAVGSAALASYRAHEHAGIWTPDGSIYIAMTLEDRGLSQQDAWRAAAAFMRTTAEGRANPSFYSAHPPAFFKAQRRLFRNRPLYPALAAILPTSAPAALKIVSVAAYGLAALALFSFMLQWTVPWIAAFAGLIICNVPAVYRAAGLALTDELALLLWIAAFGVLASYLHKPNRFKLASFIVAAAALTLARPAIYLPLGAAGAALAWTWHSPPARYAVRACIGVAAVAAGFAVYTMAVGGADVRAELAWDFQWQHAIRAPFTEHGFPLWWRHSAVSAASAAVGSLYTNLGPFELLLAAAAFILARHAVLTASAAGAIAAAVLALASNPFSFAVERTVTLPLVPVVTMLAASTLAVAFDSMRYTMKEPARALIGQTTPHGY